MITKLIDYLNERLRTVKILSMIAVAIMLLWTILGADSSHAHTWMEKYIPGFWAIFTLISCCVLIIFARLFGKCGIQTREDYYDK